MLVCLRLDTAVSTDTLRTVVVIHGKVVASATDSSSQIATRKVSLAALDVLTNDPELLTRLCDCKTGTSNKTATPQNQDAKSGEPAEEGEVPGTAAEIADGGA